MSRQTLNLINKLMSNYLHFCCSPDSHEKISATHEVAKEVIESIENEMKGTLRIKEEMSDFYESLKNQKDVEPTMCERGHDRIASDCISDGGKMIFICDECKYEYEMAAMQD